ncbi:MAG: pyridoxamine 5'-phosphate oxidase family protein [Flavobacteriales bacterium]
MSNHARIRDREATEKLKEIVKHQGICMMITNVDEHPTNSRPMGVGEVDDEGNFLFLTLRTSRKYADVTKDPRVYLYFANPGDQEFLSVLGTAEVLNDMAKKKDLWNPLAKAWVPDGVENPDLRVMKVVPQDGYYWDTRDGKVVAAVKIAFALITGKTSDDGGVEGRVKV